ncbi:nucleotidyltransferase domain-containing protein [Caldibacillus lycopersici]|uniref:Nucleotidyltransferase domain-containing protein n=1 Tax=Perspicuibacillus lycopersici TaxID=1325689 RepID=A0AAE3LPC8_9BACI|nr:nucleotidyltransferase domain-containing protein [Perspicuibacillus lycopersici]MCU9614817.1 nucleotidyltransferase domain-containing protein [Perspicuibacillus lycopersici]
MVYRGEASRFNSKAFIFMLQKRILEILKDEVIGIYAHGSFAMGGFNPNGSDIDLLVVTTNSLTVNIKRELAKLFLLYSASPFPIEISFLHREQLNMWKHPCPFDFHYSEFWR